jgi:hypothetical protein
MGPQGSWNQDWLCWRGPAAIYRQTYQSLIMLKQVTYGNYYCLKEQNRLWTTSFHMYLPLFNNKSEFDDTRTLEWRTSNSCAILGCDTMWSCRWIPTFLKGMVPPSSRSLLHNDTTRKITEQSQPWKHHNFSQQQAAVRQSHCVHSW